MIIRACTALVAALSIAATPADKDIVTPKWKLPPLQPAL